MTKFERVNPPGVTESKEVTHAIKHIVFDFGGVIFNLDRIRGGYPEDLAIIFSLPIEQTEKIWEENKALVSTGRESPKDFLIRMKNKLQLGFDVDLGLNFWKYRNIVSRDRIDWELIDTIEIMKQEYKIHMLTDQVNLDNGAASWISEVNDHFHTIFRSYEQGLQKLDQDAFHNLLNKIGADPSEVIFVDDSDRNIQTARKAGINGIRHIFGCHNLLIREFRNFGVSVPIK